MRTLFRSFVLASAAVTGLLFAHAIGGKALAFPLFHRAPHAWTQFRLGPDNNAVIGGRLQTAWRIETHGQISASPSLVDGTIYIGNNSGKLFAIDAATGRVKWTYHVNNPLMSAPIVYSNLVIVGEGDATSQGAMPPEPVEVGQGPSALFALDRYTGKLAWRNALAGSAMPTPAIVDGLLVHHDGAGWVSAYDPLTGQKRYSRHLQSVASMSAILPAGRTDFISAGVGLNATVRLNAATGTTVWQHVFPWGASGLGDCPPASDASRVYCNYMAPVAPDRGTQVGRPGELRAFALDIGTGALLWDVPLERGVLPPRNEAAIPLLAAGKLFEGSSLAAAMHAIDPATGKILWTRKTRGPIKGGAVYVDGLVYFGDLGGYLWAVDAATGAVVGAKNMHSAFNVGSPIVAGKTLVLGSDAGTVFAVPLQVIRTSHDA